MSDFCSLGSQSAMDIIAKTLHSKKIGWYDMNTYKQTHTGFLSNPFVHYHHSKMGSQANWHSFEGIVTSLLDGNPIAIIVTALFAFGLPVLLHLIFYRSVASPPSSNFLLLGPSGAGKTALLTLVNPSFLGFLWEVCRELTLAARGQNIPSLQESPTHSYISNIDSSHRLSSTICSDCFQSISLYQ